MENEKPFCRKIKNKNEKTTFSFSRSPSVAQPVSSRDRRRYRKAIFPRDHVLQVRRPGLRRRLPVAAAGRRRRRLPTVVRRPRNHVRTRLCEPANIVSKRTAKGGGYRWWEGLGSRVIVNV